MLSPHDSVPQAILIGERRIGDDGPVFVIAEAGVNHNGDLSTAFELIDAAADAGADAVKFQYFTASRLVTKDAGTAAYQKNACGHASQYEMLRQLELPTDAYAKLRERCAKRTIIMLATPFDVPSVAEIRALRLPAIKIASSDITNYELLQAAMAASVPLIVSTGAADEHEIRSAVERLRMHGAGGRFALLHCVSSYPTPPAHANLRAIASLHTAFGVPVGFSDHTTSVETGAWAVAAGACILEKHLTLDPTVSGPDHKTSLDPPQMARYIAAARQAHTAMGDGRLDCAPIEQDVRTAARRSLVAACDIKAGAFITQDMVALKRPGTGLGGEAQSAIVGRRAAHEIRSDTLLTLDMVAP